MRTGESTDWPRLGHPTKILPVREQEPQRQVLQAEVSQVRVLAQVVELGPQQQEVLLVAAGLVAAGLVRPEPEQQALGLRRALPSLRRSRRVGPR